MTDYVEMYSQLQCSLDTTAQQIAFPPHSSRIPGSILCSSYHLCRVLYFPHILMMPCSGLGCHLRTCLYQAQAPDQIHHDTVYMIFFFVINIFFFLLTLLFMNLQEVLWHGHCHGNLKTIQPTQRKVFFLDEMVGTMHTDRLTPRPFNGPLTCMVFGFPMWEQKKPSKFSRLLILNFAGL